MHEVCIGNPLRVENLCFISLSIDPNKTGTILYLEPIRTLRREKETKNCACQGSCQGYTMDDHGDLSLHRCLISTEVWISNDCRSTALHMLYNTEVE
jgi:hypothetical protein